MSEDDKTYSLPEVKYLGFNKSLIEDVHTDLPNPYYKQQIEQEKERTDYAHPTEKLIRSIVLEYGPFNELTEDKLRAMVDKENGGKNEESMDIDDANDGNHIKGEKSSEDETPALQLDNELLFYQKRDELLKYVREALGSSTLTLDFISLLLSSVRPAAGSSSMSEHLKQNINIGSLSCDRIDPNIRDHEEHMKQRNMESMKVGRGWKLQSLQKSSNFVKDAVKRLGQTIEEENTYWNEVLDVLDAGELVTLTSAPVSRQVNTGRQRRVLAVKYGYGDSGSNYFDKGIAILEKSENGHLNFEKLDQNEREKMWGGEKIVSVKIFKKPTFPNEHTQLIGQSDSFGTIQREILQNDDSFVARVKNSRFFIFENELFWHLMKEAAGLITVHVTIVDSCIRIDLSDCYIQLESLDVFEENLKLPTPELPANDRADKIIKLLRILLCANNYKNTQKLHIPPVAMSKENSIQKSKHGFLIRPIIMYSKHNNMINQFKDLFLQLLLELNNDEKKAEDIIQKNLILKKYITDPNLLKQFQTSKRCYNNDPFLRIYSKIAPTSLLILKHNNLKVWVELKSSYSTLHISMNVKVIKLDNNEKLLESTFSSIRDVEECLSWVLKQYKQ